MIFSFIIDYLLIIIMKLYELLLNSISEYDFTLTLAL